MLYERTVRQWICKFLERKWQSTVECRITEIAIYTNTYLNEILLEMAGFCQAISLIFENSKQHELLH